MTDSAHILVVDNYDSFVYTIVGYLQTLGATVDVVRNDAIDPAAPGVLDGYDGVLISPGPGAPAESGASEDMIRLCAASGVPMFGVCLAVEPDSVPDTLVVTAWTQGDHIIQGVRVKGKPMYAVQFHPESVMTQDGYRLLANWLKVCGQDNAVAKSAGLQPKVTK